jgi:hypothetical protein
MRQQSFVAVPNLGYIRRSSNTPRVARINARVSSSSRERTGTATCATPVGVAVEIGVLVGVLVATLVGVAVGLIVTKRHAENSDVLPAASIAVAVANSPGAILAKCASKSPWQSPSVTTEADPT